MGVVREGQVERTLRANGMKRRKTFIGCFLSRPEERRGMIKVLSCFR